MFTVLAPKLAYINKNTQKKTLDISRLIFSHIFVAEFLNQFFLPVLYNKSISDTLTEKRIETTNMLSRTLTENR